MEKPDLKTTIELALKTLSLPNDYIIKEFKVSPPLKSNSDYLRIPFHLIYKIFKDLYLDDSFYRCDYREENHLKQICSQIEKGKFSLERNSQIDRAWRDYKRERRKVESNNYGLILRWRIRFLRFYRGGE